MIAGLDIGGTKVALALATEAGAIVETARFATRPERGPEAVVAEMVAVLGAMRDRHGATLARLGVACVGPLDLATGTILSPPNFPGWDQVPLRAMLETALGVEVVVDNDANAAALGEYRTGAGVGARSLVYATVSTGIGGGIVLDGRLLHGLAGAAGEFGHMTLDPNGPLCGCGNRGCFEALASGPAIVKRAKAGLADGSAAAILAAAGGDPEAIHPGHVAEAAAMGDPFASAQWEEATDWLALGLGNVVTTLAPDRLVLGGGVSAIGPALLAPVRAKMAKRVRMLPVEQLDIRLAAHGGEAGLQGALALASTGSR